jgi:hypothetical protein
MIARHMEIEAVLTRELNLTETLDALGLAAGPSNRAHRHSILENGREVFRGSCSDVWEWLRMGCTWEDPDV